MNKLEKKVLKLSSFKIRKIDSLNFIVSLRNRQRIELYRKKRFQSGFRAFVFVSLISLITLIQLDNSNFQYDTLDMVSYYQGFDNGRYNVNDVLADSSPCAWPAGERSDPPGTVHAPRRRSLPPRARTPQLMPRRELPRPSAHTSLTP